MDLNSRTPTMLSPGLRLDSAISPLLNQVYILLSLLTEPRSTFECLVYCIPQIDFDSDALALRRSLSSDTEPLSRMSHVWILRFK
jgi:hypothetical protein